MSETRLSNPSKNIECVKDRIVIIKKVIEYLQLFLPLTLAKRLVAIILLAAGVPVSRVTELSGVCDRSTRGLMKSLREEDIAGLLAIKRGSGKKRSTAGFEDEIIAEIERNNYHTRQQIADMIQEKFHIQVSVSTVGRLLKKRYQETEKRFSSGESRHGKTACILRQSAETTDG